MFAAFSDIERNSCLNKASLGKIFYCEAVAAFAFFFFPPGADFSVFTAAEDFSASSRVSRSAARAWKLFAPGASSSTTSPSTPSASTAKSA